MTTQFQIHPAIGIARVGNSVPAVEENHHDDAGGSHFYLAPETWGGLPNQCDHWGNPDLNDSTGKPIPVDAFKDKQLRVKRQAARFRIYVYDDTNPEGRLLQIGDNIQGIGSAGKLIDIKWTVHLANKKAAWYEFKQLEGEHGYGPEHPLRNADVTDDQKRQMLVIDPGPQTISGTRTKAEFSKGKNPGHTQTFPPPLTPNNVDTLGEIITNDAHDLLVLGGLGNAGSYKTGFGEPHISTYANNDGWFDDTSDGPVTALLAYYDELDQQVRYLQVADPAWVIVGYPGYAPQIPDMVNMNDVIQNTAIREFAYDTYLYGTGDFEQPPTITEADLPQWRLANKRYNPDYYPYFYRDIWPILVRPFMMRNVTTFLGQSFDPHEIGERGNFQEDKMAQPPQDGCDPYQSLREKIWLCLRQPGQENVFYPTDDPDSFQYMKPLMPLLAGDNALSNTLPSKFLRLTDTMLFLLKQWKDGKFINEKLEGMEQVKVGEQASPGKMLDQGVLSNGLGGAFMPGGEVCWIIRNPKIYSKPWRIKVNRDYIPSMQTDSVGSTPGLNIYKQPALNHGDVGFANGLEPGDLTKYSAIPWHSDFNECSRQTIDVTYEMWNQQYIDDDDAKAKLQQQTNLTLWWPTHRPMEVNTSQGPAYWSRGISQDNAGDLRMTTAWQDLGFILGTPVEDKIWKINTADFTEIERNDVALGPVVDMPIAKPKSDPA